MTRALFLDRDGVINEPVYYASSDEWESPRTVADVKLIDGAADAIHRAAADGWTIVVVTNQPSAAKGKTSRQDLLDVHEAIVAGLPIAKSYLCFHHPEGLVAEWRAACDCRKPGTRFLLEAAEEFAIDMTASWMAGDRDADLQCGRAAGCRVALIEHPRSADRRGAVEPDLRCRDLADFVERLRSE